MESEQSSRIKTECSEDIQDKNLQNEVPTHLFQYLPFSSNGIKLQSVCRICLNIINDNKVSLLTEHGNQMLIDLLKVFSSIQKFEIYPEDSLPSYICENCHSDVIYCYNFKIKCEKSDSILQLLQNDPIIVTDDKACFASEIASGLELKNAVTVKDEVKEEICVEEDYLEDLNDLSSDNETLYIVQNTGSGRETLEIAVTESKNHTGKNEIQEKKINKQYTCNFCFKKFDKVKTLKAHIARKHSSGEYTHPCDRCKEVFCSQHDLQVHSAVHSIGPLWSCNKCQKAFKARSQLRRHIQRHMEAKRFSCESCGKSFSELYALRRHVRVHTGETLEKKFACHLCDKRYSEKNQLRAHVAAHLGERRCVCAACGKAFTTASLLASHRLVHSDLKPYACSYCDQRFRHQSTRNTHHRTHTGEKPYVCATCGKAFIQNSNLTLHMRTHTGEKPYPCDKCDRRFATGSSLKNHQWRHSGAKPCGCSICGKRFTRKDMTVHMRSHKNDRQHACSACPKRFHSAARLRDHTRIHTGEKPFECATCTDKFSSKSQLAKHLKKHQMKKKCDKRELVVVQKLDFHEPIFLDNQFIIADGEEAQQLAEQKSTDNETDCTKIKENITLKLTPEVPVEVTRELVVQDDCDVKEILVVDNSHSDANYQSGNICINTDGVNYVNSDVNLVTVNEGTTVKLYQLDQSLVQIHSSGGQVTISKITSKMTANF